MTTIAAILAIIFTFFSSGINGNKRANIKKTQTSEPTSVVITKAPPTAVPTPALLPGLIGLGLGVLRKRKSEEVETEV